MVIVCCCNGESSAQATGAASGPKKLKATMPEKVAEFLGVKSGDILDWQLEIKNGHHVAIVSRQEKRSS